MNIDFKPSVFLNRLSQSINSNVKDELESLQRELLNRTKKLKPHVDQNAIINRLETGFAKLQETSANNFGRNLNKFRFYIARNIFTVPVQTIEQQSSSSRALSLAQPSEHSAQQLAARERFEALKEENDQLEFEVAQMTKILTDMKSSMFTLRLEMQNFDSTTGSGMAEHVVNFSRNEAILKGYIRDGADILSQLTAVGGMDVVESYDQQMEQQEEGDSVPMDIADQSILADGSTEELYFVASQIGGTVSSGSGLEYL